MVARAGLFVKGRTRAGRYSGCRNRCPSYSGVDGSRYGLRVSDFPRRRVLEDVLPSLALVQVGQALPEV